MVLENLEPKEVFRFFEEICQVPHGTFDTKRISDYCVAFAKKKEDLHASRMRRITLSFPNREQWDMRTVNRSLFRDIWIWYVRNVRNQIMILRKIRLNCM